jgi:hypothetical protein
MTLSSLLHGGTNRHAITYDPDALDVCRAAGAAVEISPAGQEI